MASPVQTVKLARAVLAMVTLWSWMANARTSAFSVRIPVWNRSGLTLSSAGSNNMLLLFFARRGCMLLTDVCAGFICYCYGRSWGWCILGTLGAPWSLVHMEGAGFASFSPHVYQTRVTEVCLSLDTPFGRRSVGAFSA